MIQDCRGLKIFETKVFLGCFKSSWRKLEAGNKKLWSRFDSNYVVTESVICTLFWTLVEHLAFQVYSKTIFYE